MNSKNLIVIIIILIIMNLTLAIIPHLIVKPFWIPNSQALKFTTLFEALYTLLILPLLLLLVNKKVNKKMKNDSFIINAILIIISIFISNYYHYQNFADMTGNGDHPDRGTAIAKIVVLVGGIIVAGIGIGIKLLKDSKTKKI